MPTESACFLDVQSFLRAEFSRAIVGRSPDRLALGDNGENDEKEPD